MELKRYLAILWPWKWLIITGIILGAVSAAFYTRQQTPVYRATTRLMVNESPTGSMLDYGSIMASSYLAETYAELFSMPSVLETTLARMGLADNPAARPVSISAAVVRSNQFLNVTVDHHDPNLAAAIANMLVEVFDETTREMRSQRIAESRRSLQMQMDTLELRIGEQESALGLGAGWDPGRSAPEIGSPGYDLLALQSYYHELQDRYESLGLLENQSLSNLVQLDPAKVPGAPYKPRPLTNIMLGAGLGLGLALAIVMLIEYLDDTVKSPDDALDNLGLPMIGLIARMDDPGAGSLHVKAYPRSPTSEAFRTLRTNIEFAGNGRTIRSLLVTSAGPGEGKTTIASNLAVVFAQGGRRVILVDADMRKPRIHRVMGVANRSGLSELIASPRPTLNGSGQIWQSENLVLITSGGIPPNPSELLGSEGLTSLLGQLEERADIVVFDSPPAGVVIDAAVLAAQVDAVLLVIEPESTTLGAARHVMEQFERAGAKVIGLVFNNVPTSRMGLAYQGRYGRYVHGYTYFYSYEPDGEVQLRGKKRK